MPDDKSSYYKDAVDLCINFIQRSGFHPNRLTKWGILHTIWGLGNNMFLFVLVCLDFVLTENTIDSFSKKMEAFLLFITAFMRYLVLWLNRKNIHHTLNSRQLFGSADELPEREKKAVEWLIRYPLTAFKLYYYMISASAVILFLKPFLSENREMPLDSWVPEELHWKIIIYFSQVAVISYNRIIFIGLDCFFLAICAQVILQFKILKYKMEHLNFEDATEVQEIVDRHNFLVKFVQKLRDIFSLFFLVQVMVTTLIICMELYLASTTSESIGYAIKNVFVCVNVIWQFTFYCIPATEVSSQAMELTDTIYDSKWYNFHPKLTKCVCLIIVRAQKRLAFTAGGFQDIDRETLTAVFKTSMSFYTMMKTIQEK